MHCFIESSVTWDLREPIIASELEFMHVGVSANNVNEHQI